MGDRDRRKLGTEVVQMPAALVGEKEGSFTNTHRLVEWQDKAGEPPGDARSVPWFLYKLGNRLRELYAAETDQSPIRVRQLLDLTWDYPSKGVPDEPDVEMIVREINGVHTADGTLVKDFNELKDDGSTACGCWIYSGIMPQAGHNLARNRQPDPANGPGTHLNWGFSWPANRRMLYNRASADPNGQPWSEQKRYIWWDDADKKWDGYDVPDFALNKAPNTPPKEGAFGLDAHSGADPFIMKADGKGWLWTPTGLVDE